MGSTRQNQARSFDPRWGYWEDGIYASILIAEYLSDNNISLSKALEWVPVYHSLQKNLLPSGTLDLDCVRSQMSEKFSGQVESFDELDGVKLNLKDGVG